MSTPTAHALLSPSSAERWLNCTLAPRLEADLPESTSEYAEEGRLAHSVCELSARKKFTPLKTAAYNNALKKLKADPLWNDEMLTTAAAYVEHLTENAMRFEHAPYVALEVKVDITEYAPDAFGTCDCVMIGGDELIITDYKHGKGVAVSAQGNPQMRLYALSALKLYSAIYGDRIRRVSFYIDQPRLDSYGGDSMTVEELMAWGASEVKPKAAAAYAGVGSYAPGDWCRFCRAKAKCRARADNYTALEDFKDALLPTPENMDAWHKGREDGKYMPPLLTDAEIGNLLKRAEELVNWYDALKEYAHATILAGGTIPGWKLIEGRSVRKIPNYDTAAATLIKAGYAEALLYRREPITMGDLDKLVGGDNALKELLGDCIIKPPGKPALAPAGDKRPAYSRAAADFKGVTTEVPTDDAAGA